MHRSTTFALFALAALPLAARDFSGQAAFDYTRKAVSFGPRSGGSAALTKTRAWIKQELSTRGCQLIPDAFIAQSPDASVPMENIICKFPGKSGKAIAITGHFDTKKMANFVGANDGGSSTGFLLELAAVLQGQPRIDDVYIVFFDGEEAFHDWTDTDSVYGSRHLAKKWSADGTNAKLKALINVDMIGQKDLHVVYEMGSAATIRNMVWSTAQAMGYTSAFARSNGSAVADDHMPFINEGVKALDLIDFDSQSTFWHTPQDTMDKLSPESFEIVGRVVVRVIGDLEQQK
jgi:Zn-dependent M28 family amino/carboxypeptidase